MVGINHIRVTETIFVHKSERKCIYEGMRRIFNKSQRVRMRGFLCDVSMECINIAALMDAVP